MLPGEVVDAKYFRFVPSPTCSAGCGAGYLPVCLLTCTLSVLGGSSYDAPLLPNAHGNNLWLGYSPWQNVGALASGETSIAALWGHGY